MKKEYLTRRDTLILTAIEIIDKLGIQGLTIRELANAQCITEGAIYKHFKTKNEIILAVLDEFSNFDCAIINAIKEQNMDTKKGIIFFTKSYAEYYENYPELTGVAFIYDYIRNEPELAKHMKKILDYKFISITEIINEGKKRNEISSNIDPEEFSHIIFGVINEMIFKWRIKEYTFGLKEKMLSAVAAVLKLC